MGPQGQAYELPLTAAEAVRVAGGGAGGDGLAFLDVGDGAARDAQRVGHLGECSERELADDLLEM